MCRLIPKWLCNSVKIILSEYTIFIVTLPISYLFLSPMRASCIAAGTFIICTLIALCSWYTRRNQESQQQEVSTVSNPVIIPEPSDRQLLDGLPPSLIDSLPTYIYENEGEVDSLDCAICLGAIHQNEIVKQLPFCTHLFHKDCIDKWLGFHSTCPVCRIMMNLDLEAEITFKVNINQSNIEQQ